MIQVDVERLANKTKRGNRPRPSPNVDPVRAEVIRAAAETICYEMITHLKLTATTPFLNQTQEFNANIMDAEGRLIFAFGGIPAFLMMPTIPARFALEFFGKDGLFEGDVLACNDPYHGMGHVMDFTVFAPVYHEGELVFIAAIETHHTDVGGAAPGGYVPGALDIWAEGVRWPPIKLLEKGVERKDVLRAIQVNSRVPTLGSDIQAQIGACRLGVMRLQSMLKKYTADTMKAATEYVIQYSERRFMEEVSKWPEGEYEADLYLEHDTMGHKEIHLHVKVTVKGGRLTVDFTGTDDRPELQCWSTYAITRGFVTVQIGTTLDDPHIPKNEGFLENIDLIVPKGCVFNARDGKPVSFGTHQPGSLSCTVLCKALAKVAPKRSQPQSQGYTPPWIISGMNPSNGQFFVDPSVEIFATANNAIYGQDAWGALTTVRGSLLPATAELTEVALPNRMWVREYMIDSGGPGQWRGGCGTLLSKELTAPGHLTTAVYGTKYPCPGIAGGKAGGPMRAIVGVGGPREVEVEEVANRIPILAGEKVERYFPGGGGWGDPLDRDPDKVKDDVLDEFVSREAAEREYGVVVKGAIEDYSIQVDYPATESLRRRLRGRTTTSGNEEDVKASTHSPKRTG